MLVLHYHDWPLSLLPRSRVSGSCAYFPDPDLFFPIRIDEGAGSQRPGQIRCQLSQRQYGKAGRPTVLPRLTFQSGNHHYVQLLQVHWHVVYLPFVHVLPGL